MFVARNLFTELPRTFTRNLFNDLQRTWFSSWSRPVAGLLKPRSANDNANKAYLPAESWIYKFESAKPKEIVPVRPDIFLIPVRVHVLNQVVRWQLAKDRHMYKTKTRSEIRGSTRKTQPQKGMGKARRGTRRAPRFVGGAKAHGPVLRSFAFKLIKKVRHLGLKTAFASKYQEGNLVIVDKINVPSGKTRDLVSILTSNNLYFGKRVLLISNEISKELKRASSNLKNGTPSVKVISSEESNVYDIIRARKIIMCRDSLDHLNNFFPPDEIRVLSMNEIHQGGSEVKLNEATN